MTVFVVTLVYSVRPRLSSFHSLFHGNSWNILVVSFLFLTSMTIFNLRLMHFHVLTATYKAVDKTFSLAVLPCSSCSSLLSLLSHYPLSFLFHSLPPLIQLRGLGSAVNSSAGSGRSPLTNAFWLGDILAQQTFLLECFFVFVPLFGTKL